MTRQLVETQRDCPRCGSDLRRDQGSRVYRCSSCRFEGADYPAARTIVYLVALVLLLSLPAFLSGVRYLLVAACVLVVAAEVDV